MKRIALFAALTALLIVPIFAEGEEASDDDFFGDSVVSEKPIETTAPKEDSLTAAQPLTWGGNFRFKVDVNAQWKDDFEDWTFDYFWAGDGEASKVDLASDLYFIARPNSAQRYYGKLKIEYPFDIDYAYLSGLGSTSTLSVPNIKIWELYADFDIEDTLYLRAGKQMTKWGVGYFFQPADIIALSPVDPQNPETDREGPIMVKVNLPIDVQNIDAYVIAPEGLTSIGDLAYALRAKFLVGNTQIGVGARYQHVPEGRLGSPFQGIATVSTSLWKFSLFAEGVVKYGSSKQFMQRASGSGIMVDPDGTGPSPALPTGLNVITRPNDWFFNGTAGFIFTNSDWFLTVMGQYLYNGEGYAENLSDLKDGAMLLLMDGKLSMGDLQNIGQHYAAANIIYTFTNNSKVKASAFWMGNLADGSGFINPRVDFQITDEICAALKGSVKYGDQNTEYGSSPALPRMSLGFEISLAPGSF